jgi:hypothetical protein
MLEESWLQVGDEDGKLTLKWKALMRVTGRLHSKI